LSLLATLGSARPAKGLVRIVFRSSPTEYPLYNDKTELIYTYINLSCWNLSY
jgi:hypothetical protein